MIINVIVDDFYKSIMQAALKHQANAGITNFNVQVDDEMIEIEDDTITIKFFGNLK